MSNRTNKTMRKGALLSVCIVSLFAASGAAGEATGQDSIAALLKAPATVKKAETVPVDLTAALAAPVQKKKASFTIAAAPQRLTAPTGDETATPTKAMPKTPTAKPMPLKAKRMDKPAGSEITVVLNKSQIITTRAKFREISVGNPEVADVVPLARDRFYVIGKEVGSTNVVLTDSRGNVIDVIDVLVGYDIQSLKRKIYELAPNDGVEVRAANDSIVLSGTVDSAEKAGRIAALAERYAPEAVTNMMSVSGSQQVMLQVKFAEVQRSALKDFGNQFRVRDLDGGQAPVGLFGGLFDEFGAATGDGVNPMAYFSGGATIASAGDVAVDAVFDALEEKGLVRTLAEPNMIALSGDTASFLAGGEFPIPVAVRASEEIGRVTVEFKEFGVGLSFTPTVVDLEKINLELRAEVSTIDPSISIITERIVIPGLKVRRTNTTVELLDGQSFAIAGLIQDDLENAVRTIPGIGSIPILGALARSQDFERRQTELVVIITARLVQPVSGDKLAAPTDHFLPPTEFDMFLFGDIFDMETIAKAGGVDGEYGYEQP